MTEYLRELRHATDGDYVEVWFVPPPAFGEKYQVIEQWWNDDLTERHILRINPQSPGAQP